MLDYQPVKSPFYESNKQYCEQVTQELDSQGYIYTGFCNSYGYDIYVDFTYNGLHFDFNFHKHQSTMQGGWYPCDAVNYSDIIIKITKLKDPLKLTLINTGVKALFVMGRYKYYLDNGQIIKSTEKLNQEQFNQMNQIVNNGKWLPFLTGCKYS